MSTHFKNTKIYINFEDERLLTLFERVWESLPAEDQRSLEQNLVNVTDDLWLSVPGVAAYDPFLRTIQFRRNEIEQLDSDVVMHMIAWILAHALWNRSGTFLLENGNDSAADMQAEAWGYPRPDRLVNEIHRN